MTLPANCRGARGDGLLSERCGPRHFGLLPDAVLDDFALRLLGRAHLRPSAVHR